MKFLTALLASLALAPTALAAAPEPVKSRFYIFDGSSFEGRVSAPGLDVFGPRQAARFGRMLDLKKDLLPGLATSLKERTFK
jgi:hypothetical protein